MPRYGRAVLGGTFDRLHVGHLTLLSTAFRLGRTVAIGVTSARFLAEHAKPGSRAIQPYALRVRSLRRWLERNYATSRYRIRSLDDPFGGSVEEGVDVLVVSVETAGGGRRVNEERRRLGRPSVPIVVVPVVLADDLEPVSSRRIRAGAIDRRGRRRSPLRVGIALEEPSDRRAAVEAVRRTFPRARVRVALYPPARGAFPAVRAGRIARRALSGTELAVGIAKAGARRSVVECGPRVVLEARSLPARSPVELGRALEGLLRPSRPQPL